MRNNQPVTESEVIYAASANILSTTGLKSHITYVNDDFIDISGFEKSELIGQPHNIVRHPTMPSKAFEMLWSRVQAGKSWMGMVKNRCKNGDHYWVDAYVTPILKNGEVEEYQSVRVQPKREYVERASALYKAINNGETPRCLKYPALDIRIKLLVAIAVAVSVVLFIANLFFPLSVGLAVTLFFLLTAFVAVGQYVLLSPLLGAIKKAKSVIDDPLAMHIYTGRSDEAGQILLAIKILESETGGIVGRISDFASQVAGNAGELYQSLRSNVEEIEQLYGETDQVATATNEMSASIQQVAQNAQLAADSANEALDNAVQGKQLGEEVKVSINSLAEEVSQTSIVMQQVGADTDEISTVVDVIRSVAEQTNLLALNAAIEAARAGEQGRGFAVVADEVRTLANRTHQSTEEIMTTIDKLQSGARNAVKKMNQAAKKAEDSVHEVDRAVDTIQRITNSVSTINDMNTQTATAVDQQSSVAEQISSSITRVKTLADNVMEGSKASYSSCDVVNDYTQQLIQLANQFWEKKRA